MDLSLAEYRALAEFRLQVRRFLRFSEDQARSLGLEPQQHQLLLAIRGLPPGVQPTVGEFAGRLHLKHNSMVELVDRLEARGYVQRFASPEDRRSVLVRLTPSGLSLLRRLSLIHREELKNAAPMLLDALHRLQASGVAGNNPERRAL